MRSLVAHPALRRGLAALGAGSTTPLDTTWTTAHAQTTGASPDIQFTTTTGPPPLSIDHVTSKDGRRAGSLVFVGRWNLAAVEVRP